MGNAPAARVLSTRPSIEHFPYGQSQWGLAAITKGPCTGLFTGFVDNNKIVDVGNTGGAGLDYFCVNFQEIR